MNLVVKDATKKKQWEKELDTINNSIKGKAKIDAAATVSEIGSNNSKETLFKIAKELHLLTTKILSSLHEEPPSFLNLLPILPLRLSTNLWRHS